jgi:hypothetical protein
MCSDLYACAYQNFRRVCRAIIPSGFEVWPIRETNHPLFLAHKSVEVHAQRKDGFPSLRFRFRLRRSYDQRLVVFERASTEILRARQRLLGELGLAELPIC